MGGFSTLLGPVMSRKLTFVHGNIIGQNRTVFRGQGGEPLQVESMLVGDFGFGPISFC